MHLSSVCILVRDWTSECLHDNENAIIYPIRLHFNYTLSVRLPVVSPCDTDQLGGQQFQVVSDVYKLYICAAKSFSPPASRIVLQNKHIIERKNFKKQRRNKQNPNKQKTIVKQNKNSYII